MDTNGNNSESASNQNNFTSVKKSKIYSATGLTTIIIFLIILSIGALKFYKAIPLITDFAKQPLKQPVASQIKTFESEYNSNSEAIQKEAVNLIGYSEKALGKKVTETPLMTLAVDTDGHPHRILPNIDITNNLNNLKAMLKHLTDKNIKNAFFLVPCSVVKGKTQLPLGVTDYQNITGDRVVSELKSAGIRTVDLREEFQKMKVDPQKVFFNTDHHWKIPYAFFAAKVSAQYLNTAFKFKLDPYNVYSGYANYEEKTYPKAYEGSYTTAVGESFVGAADDFTTLLPKFKTSFRYRSLTSDGTLEKTLAGRIMDYTGPFETALYNGGHTYTSYFKGGTTHLVVDNYLATNKLKCLVVGTSHARAASAFLTLYFKQLVFVDMQGSRFSNSLYSYIDDLKPDVVIVMYAPYTFSKNTSFNFK